MIFNNRMNNVLYIGHWTTHQTFPFKIYQYNLWDLCDRVLLKEVPPNLVHSPYVVISNCNVRMLRCFKF